MKKIFKILLIILIILMVAAADLWAVIRFSLPLWLGGAILLGIFGIAIGVLFIRKYFLRRKERKFVHRVVQLDEAAIRTSPLHERKELEELQEKWRQSVELLKKSDLRRRGNPLYVLPWFLVVGESGSGKTSALRSARLDSPLLYPDPTGGIAATRNCDWWFYDAAIVLDTAGRYTIPTDEVPDREEWEEFLVLLAKYRKREPVNGVIVTVPADKILGSDRDKLRIDGQNIRKRIDQVMRVVGARFPVYVLVTKMDRVYGFTDTFLGLPEEETNQALGFLVNHPRTRWEEVLEQTFIHIEEQLRSTRFSLLHRAGEIKPGTLLLPTEFADLKPGLAEFLKDVFVENPYQETPFLRGIYFSSSLQDGASRSKFFELTGEAPEPAGVASRSRGLFLKDFFSRVLPGDRSLYTRVYEFIRWQRWTRGLGFASWVFIWLALCGVLTYSFFTNYAILNKFTARFSKAPVLRQIVPADLVMLEEFRIDLQDMERANHRWFMPRLGLSASLRAEQKGKDLYVGLFRKGVQRPFDRAFFTEVDQVTQRTDPALLADYASYIVARAGTLDSFTKHGKVTETADLTRTATAIMKTVYPSSPTEVFETFGNTYSAYLTWTPDKAELTQSRELFSASLNALLRKSGNLEWLVKQPIANTPDIRLTDYWEKMDAPSLSTGTDSMVPGAYTNQGKANIETFIKSLQTVTVRNTMLKDDAKAFWDWYGNQYYEAWLQFARRFPKGADVYTPGPELTGMATVMTTDHSPYWRLLDRMAEEFTPSGQSGRSPQWVQLALEMKEMKTLLAQAAPKEQKPTLKETIEKDVKKVETRVKKAEEKIAQPPDPRQQEIEKKRPTAAKSLGEYKKSLEQVAPVAASPDTSFQMVSDFFTEQGDFSKSKSPYNLSYVNYVALKNVLKDEFRDDVDPIWALVAGPLQFLIRYGVETAGTSLQAQWEGDVLGKMEGAPKDTLSKLLFDKTDGLVLKFRDGPAKPFLVPGKWGYVPRKAYEKSTFETSIAFKNDFLRFLNTRHTGQIAERQSAYSVHMDAVPIAVNSDATVKPIGNVVTVQCADGDLVLYNYNYPDSKTFNWAPDKCGTTTVKILFPDNVSLRKIYPDATGFPRFLRDFETGHRTFKPEDFPDKKSTLTRNGIKWIKVSYRIQNGVPVINTLKKPAGVHVPAQITSAPSTGTKKQ